VTLKDTKINKYSYIVLALMSTTKKMMVGGGGELKKIYAEIKQT
jgi:hypothetical protein